MPQAPPWFPASLTPHTHVASSGLRHLKSVDCDLRSISAIQQAIRERASKTKTRRMDYFGFKFDDTKTAEGRTLTKADLDAAAPNNPVMVTHRGGHTSYVNTKALNIADVNNSTPDPKAVSSIAIPTVR
jgi:predicted amidohydrolase YtcJ